MANYHGQVQAENPVLAICKGKDGKISPKETYQGHQIRELCHAQPTKRISQNDNPNLK